MLHFNRSTTDLPLDPASVKVYCISANLDANYTNKELENGLEPDVIMLNQMSDIKGNQKAVIRFCIILCVGVLRLLSRWILY
jgi:hypothetical protein